MQLMLDKKMYPFCEVGSRSGDDNLILDFWRIEVEN